MFQCENTVQKNYNWNSKVIVLIDEFDKFDVFQITWSKQLPNAKQTCCVHWQHSAAAVMIMGSEIYGLGH